MSFTVNTLAVDRGDDVYYTSAYQVMMETHLQYLKSLSSTAKTPINPGEAFKYEGDFFGLLQNVFNIPPQYHMVILRLNNYRSSVDFPSTATSILLPAGVVLETLRNLFSTVHTTL